MIGKLDQSRSKDSIVSDKPRTVYLSTPPQYMIVKDVDYTFLLPRLWSSVIDAGFRSLQASYGMDARISFYNLKA